MSFRAAYYSFPPTPRAGRSYHVKAVATLADDDRTVVARELAFATGALEVDSADAARVVGLLGQIPLPRCDGLEGVDGDLHAGWLAMSLLGGSCELEGGWCTGVPVSSAGVSVGTPIYPHPHVPHGCL